MGTDRVVTMAASDDAAGHPTEDPATGSAEDKVVDDLGAGLEEYPGDKVDSADAKGTAADSMGIDPTDGEDMAAIGATTETKHAKNERATPSLISSKKITLCFWSTNPRASPRAKADRPRWSIWSMNSQALANA